MLNSLPVKLKIEDLSLLESIFNSIKNHSYNLDFIEGIKLENSHHSELGWKLVCRTFALTIIELLVENRDSLKLNDFDVLDLDYRLNEIIEKNSQNSVKDFFKISNRDSFLSDTRDITREFFKLFELKDYEVSNIISRFNSYFTFTLIDQYQTDIIFYELSKKSVNYLEWYRYRKKLIKEVDEPIMGESFGIREIYIPLKASYENSVLVVNPANELLQWVKTKSKSDNIKIIYGESGSGKSSFLKMFAYRLAKDDYDVLSISLSDLSFKNEMGLSIKKLLKENGFLKLNPFASQRLIIIFDGLDELKIKSKTNRESKSIFIKEIKHQLALFNTTRLKLQIVISSRNEIVEFKNSKQALKLLPYQFNKNRQNRWWRNYSNLTQKDYRSLPYELRADELDFITSNPLLNHLSAISFHRGVVDFRSLINENILYNDLLNLSSFKFKHKSFAEYLTAKKIIDSLKDIDTNCDKAIKKSLVNWLNIFSLKDIDKDLHKFIDNELELIFEKDKIIAHKYQKTLCTFINYVLEKGMPIEELTPRPATFHQENKFSIKAEKALLILHGSVAKYTNISSIIEIEDEKLFGEWISRLREGQIENNNFIMQFFNNLDMSYFALSFKDFHNANLKNSKFLRANLFFAILNDTDLSFTDLRGADLRGAGLRNANLSGADLSGADLRESNLSGANLIGANLSGADLSNANLNEANLTDANLTDVDLRESNLSSANLCRVNFKGADLSATSIKKQFKYKLKLFNHSIS